MNYTKTLISLLSLAFVACGGPGSVSGTVSGLSLAVQDSIFTPIKDDDGKTVAAVIVLADKPNICGEIKANRNPKSTTSMVLALFRFSVSQQHLDFLAPDVGQYTVINSTPKGAGNYAKATFSRTDANCSSTLSEAAGAGVSGTVTVDSLKAEPGGKATGTFDITFGSNDKVKGNFNAVFCDVPPATGNPNCE
jgi:hypothetical protein